MPGSANSALLTAIHFGAGNIGRGFIGPVLVDARFHVVFADIDAELVSQINKERSYSIHYLEPHRPRPFHVSNVSGVLSTSEDLSKDIADDETRLITTSVGIAVLKHIAGVIAKGIELRRASAESDTKRKDWYLNVIACENGVGASQDLKKLVWTHLKTDKDKAWAEDHVGFANCAVDRIVPPFDAEECRDAVENELDVGVDRFYEWIVDETALKPSPQALAEIPGLITTSSLPAFVERKLFILNCGHAITAYLGFVFGFPEGTVFAAISDTKRVRPIVQGAMHESAAALLHKYPKVFKQEDMSKFVDQTLDRFCNPEVVDNIKRVGRQPLRKLAKNDRLLGPAYMAREYNLPITNLAKGVAAAMMFRDGDDDDAQAKELASIVEKEGMETAVESLTGFKKGSEEWNEIIHGWNELKRLADGSR